MSKQLMQIDKQAPLFINSAQFRKIKVNLKNISSIIKEVETTNKIVTRFKQINFGKKKLFKFHRFFLFHH